MVEPTSKINDVHALYVYDQALPGPGHTTLQEHLVAEAAVIARARSLLNTGSIRLARDFRDAAWLFQHSDDPRDYLLAHVLAIRSAELGEPTANYIVAATLDRYLQSIGRAQIFGTQYPAGDAEASSGGARSVPAPQRTQAPFDPALIPSTLRQDFCVPSLEQQQSNVIELNKGKYPDSTMVAKGCIR